MNTALEVDHLESEAQTVMFLCDRTGQIVGGNRGAFHFAGTESAAPSWERKHYSEVFGPDSGLTAWLDGRLQENAKADRCEGTVDYRGVPLQAIFEMVQSGEENLLYSLCLRAAPPDYPEGTTLVSRQEWHDLKNYLGGVKLYATFLKKKLTQAEDQQIVDKMLAGINGIIDYLAKIRRGE